VIPLRAREVEGARLVAGDGARRLESVVADSRAVRPGALFVALPGERLDGHAYLAQAAERGASAVLCRPGPAPSLGAVAVLEAEDPLMALAYLARQVRRRSRAKVVGIAGSAGKTSTKDVLRALCAPHARTVATLANQNNELGLPLTVCRLEPDTEVLIAEMAMRGPGQIADLCAVAEPDLGLVTAIGPEHLEFLGTVEGVARAECELLALLPAGAPAVLPHGEPLVEPYRRADLREITFGLSPEADVHPRSFTPDGDGAAVELSILGDRAAFRTNLLVPHARLNLCAAAAVYAALDLPVEGIGEGAERCELSPWRGQERPRGRGGLLINDAYNANPVSMRAALEALVARADGRRPVAVLGEMAELGDDAPDWHRRVGEQAATAGVRMVVGVGPLAREYETGAGGRAETHWFADADAAARGLPGLLEEDDAVLLKASRAAGLERLDAAIP
jgi:UDP-N-acetylmuramoyl-tripeptide--D-alanyl-D-alanine ligase